MNTDEKSINNISNLSITTALIIAGGLGSRLKPLTDTTPKPLLPIKGQPLIEHIILNLKNQGVVNIILSVGYKADMIQNHFGDGSSLGVNISYCVEVEPLGTGGAIRQASLELNEAFFVLWGDNLMDLNCSEMINTFQNNNSEITMVLTPREDVENFGVAKLNGGNIMTFIEKPARQDAPTNLINAGAFIMDPKCLSILPAGKCSIERDCFEKLAPMGKISAYIHKGQWFPTDTLEKYHLANSGFKVKNKEVI